MYIFYIYPVFSDLSQIDPAVLDYAATKVQAGVR